MKKGYYKIEFPNKRYAIIWFLSSSKSCSLYMKIIVIESTTRIWDIGEQIEVRYLPPSSFIPITNNQKIKELDRKRLLMGI